MEFFSQDNDNNPIPNPINTIDIQGDDAEDRLFKFLLDRIKDNKQIFDIIFNSGVHDVTDIPYIDLEEWQKVLASMSQMNQKIFFKLFNNYTNEIQEPDVKEHLMQVYENLYRTGGKKTRRVYKKGKRIYTKSKRNHKITKKYRKKSYHKK